MDCLNFNNIDRKWDGLLTNISTSYAILLFCIYAAFAYTELVKFPLFNHWLEIHGFLIYLYLLSILYLIYLLIFVLRGTNKSNNDNQKIKVVENEEVSVYEMLIDFFILQNVFSQQEGEGWGRTTKQKGRR